MTRSRWRWWLLPVLLLPLLLGSCSAGNRGLNSTSTSAGDGASLPASTSNVRSSTPSTLPAGLSHLEKAGSRVGILPIVDLTPETEARVEVRDALLAGLIRGLRAARLEVVPVFDADARGLVLELKSWLRHSRRALPGERLRPVLEAVPADAYLVLWIERSARPIVESPERERKAAHRYRLEVRALWLVEGIQAIKWPVSTIDVGLDPREPGTGIARGVMDVVDQVLRPWPPVR